MASTLDHNDTTNIQGGAAGDYYHLTSAQHSVITGTKKVSMSANEFNDQLTAPLAWNLTTFMSFTTFSGTGAIDRMSCQFKVPNDYVSGGRFKICFITSTSANQTNFFMDIGVAANTENTDTNTESLGNEFLVAGGVDWDLFTLPTFAATATFAIEDSVTCNIWRDPGDVDDTNTAVAYICFVRFEYNY